MRHDAADEDGLDPAERLVEEFLARVRSGAAPDVEAFARLHPEQAGTLREVLPALLALEQARRPAPARAQDRLGRWAILRELGRGGMGVVYLAEDPATGERAALKLVAREEPEAVVRFRREAQAAARVAHPGLCRVLEVAPAGGPLWIAFEHVEGETLAHALRRERRSTGPDATTAPVAARLERWLTVGEEVAEALHAAHEAGLVHRDVKPGNVMLRPDGRAVVLDFGLAHGEDGEATRITRTGVPVGTPAYMSPEQVRAGSAPPDRRTDVWSLGATLYEAFTGEPPFGGPTVAALYSQILTSDPAPARQRNAALPRDLEVVLATTLEKRPERRYATARHLAEDLARVRRGERVRARAPGPLRRLATWAARNPRVAAVTAAVGLSLVTGLVVALVLLARVGEARDLEALAARRARARALASESADVQRTDAMLALLLAREGVRAERSPQTVTRLHQALHGSLERARLEGHGGPVAALAWDVRGKRLATGCADGRARLFEREGPLVATFPGPETPDAEAQRGGECNVALAPDGGRLVAWRPEGGTALWRADGVRLATLGEADDPTGEVRFLPDGRILVVHIGGRATLHAPEGALLSAWQVPPVEGEPGAVLTGMGVDDAGPRVHTIRTDRRVFVHDLEGREVGRREQALDAWRAMVFDRARLAFVAPRPGSAALPAEERELLRVLSVDGAPLGSVAGAFADVLVCGGDTWWACWATSTGVRVVRAADGGVRTAVLDLARSERPSLLVAAPDGSRLFTARQLADGTTVEGSGTDALRLWTPVGASLATLTAASDLVAAAAFTPDGSWIALGRHSGGLATVAVTAPVELATVVPRWRTGDGVRHPPLLSGTGRWMVGLADEHSVRVVDDEGVARATFRVAEAGTLGVRFLSLAPETGRLLVTTRDGALACYDLDGRREWAQPARPGLEQASWLGDQGGFVTQEADARVRFCGPDGAPLAEREGRLLAPAPSTAPGARAALFVEPRQVVLCDAAGQALSTGEVAAGTRAQWCQVAAAGGAVLVERPADPHAGGLGTCRCLDATGRTLWTTPSGGFGSQIAVLSPEADRVALVSSGGVSLRDGAGNELAALRLPGGIVSLAFDAGGRSLAAVTNAGAVRVWDRDGRRLFDLPDQGGAAFVAFSRDGRRLATVTASMARLFTTDADELERLADRRCTRAFTPAELVRYAEILDPAR